MNTETKTCKKIIKCSKCDKEFKYKSQLSKHSERKTPCDKQKEKCRDTDKEKNIEHKVYSNKHSSKSLKPLIKWSGGKYDEIHMFEKYIPKEFEYYIEPFVGGASVLFHLSPKKSIISDLHTELIDFYTAIKNNKSQEIYNFMSEHENDEKTYYRVRDDFEINDYLDNAKRFYYLRKTCFRGMMRYNKKGEFNIPYGKYKTCNYEDLLKKEYSNVLKNTEIFNKSFEYVFENYNSKDNFMFLDPPYDSQFTDYGYCKFGKEEHIKLYECFKSTNIRCLMVIGKTDFIKELYKDYIVEEYDKKYRFKLYGGRVGDEIDNKHLIICNYKI